MPVLVFTLDGSMEEVRIPCDVRGYLDRLVELLRFGLCDRLVGIYALGSLAFDDYRPASSDLDIYAVVHAPLAREEKLVVADVCSHRALPCPARKLELVLISAASARYPGAAPKWELNLNTGSHQIDHVGLDPAAEPRHWFVVDLAIAHERGVSLFGPHAKEVIGTPDAAAVRDAQSDVVAWFAHNATEAEMVTAACRARYWLRTGTFSAKSQALRWAGICPPGTAGPSASR